MGKKFRNLAYYFQIAWKTSKTYLIVNIVRNIFSASIPLTNVFGLGMVVKLITTDRTAREVIAGILIYLSVNLWIGIVRQLLLLAENTAMRKASNVLQFGYMEDCLNIDYHFVQDGEVLNLKRKSMKAYPAFSLNVYGAALNDLIQAAGVLSAFLLLSPRFILIILMISALLILLTIYTQKFDYEFENERVDDDRKLAYLYDVMTKYKYAKEIRMNNAGPFIRKKYSETFFAQTKKYKRLLNKKTGVNLLSVVLSIAQSAVMYLYFTWQVFSSQMDIAQYTVMIASTTLFTGVLISFFKNIGLINNTLKSVDYYREYKDKLDRNSSLSQSNRLQEVNVDYANAIIRFEGVSFQYPGSDQWILKNVNLMIHPHQKLGIVGLNGSGKTTLILLLLRIYSPTEGRITLDGRDISEIPYSQYSKHLGVILQDFSLFAYSMKENILFDQICDEDLLKKSIDLSDLRGKVSQLPKGMDTSIYRELDDEGIEFSKGEGQKLAMARAIYKNADVLLFDEPSSALDPVAEYNLFSRLGLISENKTTIFISHRLSSTHFCDHIVVLDKGTVIEQGSPSSLMQKNGFYAKLYQSQAKYYKENGVQTP